MIIGFNQFATLSKKIKFLSILLVLITIILFKNTTICAQENSNTGRVNIEGTVINAADKTPVPRATISIKGKKTNAIADDNGKFSIKASLGDILIVSSTNYNQQTVKVNQTTGIQVLMTEKDNSENEVVVVAYEGKKKRKELIQPPGKVDVEDFKKAPIQTLDQGIGGRIAGVNVTSSDGQPGAQSNIVIRGGGISQDNSPLYVVDGFPIENLDLNSINPNDIDQLEVLKDASSIAIYGARGANGVILITTKRGKTSPPVITYTASGSTNKITKNVDLLSPYEYVKLQLELDSLKSTASTQNVTNQNIYLNDTTTLEDYKNIPGIKWSDYVLRRSFTQTHSLSIIGGNADTKYAFSGSYFNLQGVVINTGTQRLDGKITLDQKINDKLKLALSLTHSNSTNFGNVSNGVGGGAAVIYGMWSYRPVFGPGRTDPINTPVDSILFNDYINGVTTTLGDVTVNPYIQAKNEFRKFNTKTTHFNISAEYKIDKHFSFKIGGGYSTTNTTNKTFYNSLTSAGINFTNPLGQTSNKNGINGSYANSIAYNILNENVLYYNNNSDINNTWNGLVGLTGQYGRYDGTGYAALNIPQANEYLGFNSLYTGTLANGFNSGSHNLLLSAIAKINYTRKRKYLFQFSIRQDGSSKFAPGKQWGYFPSGAIAWRALEEPFIRKMRFAKYFNDIKIRASYGHVGNNRVGDFAGTSQFGALQTAIGYPFTNVYTIGSQPYFLGNDKLTWETLKELDLGTTLVLANDRITIDFDYYRRRTDNLIAVVYAGAVAGYGNSNQYQNIGKISNTGIELTVSTINISHKKFRWTSNFNIAFNKSKIINFTNGVDVKSTASSLSGGQTAWVAKVGQPFSQFVGYKWAGIYQYADFNRMPNGTYILKSGIPTYSSNIQPGDGKYEDVNGDGIIDAQDQTIIGQPLPVHSGGLSNNLTFWDNFNLSIFFQWTYGNHILNANRTIFENAGTSNINQFASYANRWSPTNPTNDIPTPRFAIKGDGSFPKNAISSKLVEDGSFLRLKTISFGYNVPVKYLKKSKFVKTIRMALAAQNLLTLTKYKGLDPEVSSFRGANSSSTPPGISGSSVVGGTGYTYIQPSSGTAAFAPGYDLTAYPRSITYNFNLTVTF